MLRHRHVGSGTAVDEAEFIRFGQVVNMEQVAAEQHQYIRHWLEMDNYRITRDRLVV